ncbi:Uncharacterized protein ToN1_09240 [Aromatoleum petrolei]|nr:Uncharacterized protein ToN1_09240 [Aromatoleum petrolei]
MLLPRRQYFGDLFGGAHQSQPPRRPSYAENFLDNEKDAVFSMC